MRTLCKPHARCFIAFVVAAALLASVDGKPVPMLSRMDIDCEMSIYEQISSCPKTLRKAIAGLLQVPVGRIAGGPCTRRSVTAFSQSHAPSSEMTWGASRGTAPVTAESTAGRGKPSPTTARATALGKVVRKTSAHDYTMDVSIRGAL